MSEFMTRLKQLDWYLNIPARLPEIISGEIEKIYERQSKLEAWARFSVRILVSVSKDVSTDAGNSGPTSVSAQKTDNKAWGFFIINRMSGGQNPGQINFDVYIYEE